MRISIGMKMMALAGVSSLILVAVGLYGTWSSWSSIHHIHDGLDRIADVDHGVMRLQREYKTEVQEWKNVLLRGTDDASLKKYWDAYEAQHLKVLADAAEMLDKTQSESAKEAIRLFIAEDLKNYEQYRKAILIQKEHNFDSRPADKAVQGIDRPTLKYIQQADKEIALEAEKLGVGIIGQAESGIKLSIMVGGIVLVLEGIFFVILIRRYISIPTGKVLAGLNTLKSGDFTGTLPDISNDEIGDIAALTQQVSQELGKLVANVRLASDRLAKTAQRVAMVSSMTSEGVKNQREETDHASQAMGDMSQSMALSVERANDAVSTAVSVSKQVSIVNSVLGETIHAVQALAEGVKDTASSIQVLKDETQSIGEVAKTIRGIADQTNLLALNAAIEAARAGEQGRGFAVVADEVRKLANTTQNATSVIEKRLSALQTGASNAMIAMLEDCEHADKSIDQADEARKVLDSITLAAASIREVNEKIASILEEQKGAAGTISNTITNISQVAEQTSHSSRQTTDEIAKVAGEAALLNEMVSRFVIPANDEISPQDPSDTKDDLVELF